MLQTFYKNSDEDSGPAYYPTQPRQDTYRRLVTQLKHVRSDIFSSVVDVGGGTGFAKQLIPTNWSYLNVTMRAEELRYCGEHAIPCLHGNILNLPIEDKSADVVICVYTLLYVSNQALALSELLRVTKIGGVIGLVYDHDDGSVSSQYLNILSEHGLQNLVRRMGGKCISRDTWSEPDVRCYLTLFEKVSDNPWVMH